MRSLTTTTVMVLTSWYGAWAQTRQVAAKCPSVISKNAQEALQMEQGSNKNGCWVRLKNKDGSDAGLVFQNREGPEKSYKPIDRSSISTPQPGLSGDICQINAEERAEVRQWVNYDRATKATTLQVNLQKLADLDRTWKELCEDTTSVISTSTDLAGVWVSPEHPLAAFNISRIDSEHYRIAEMHESKRYNSFWSPLVKVGSVWKAHMADPGEVLNSTGRTDADTLDLTFTPVGEKLKCVIVTTHTLPPHEKDTYAFVLERMN
jgi:hypothetical protein